MGNNRFGSIYKINLESGYHGYIKYVGEGDFGGLCMILKGKYKENLTVDEITLLEESCMVFFSVNKIKNNQSIVLVKSGNAEPVSQPQYMRSVQIFARDDIRWAIVEVGNLDRIHKKNLTEEDKKLNPFGYFPLPCIKKMIDDDFSLDTWDINYDFIPSEKKENQ